jgi:hypothetical protein
MKELDPRSSFLQAVYFTIYIILAFSIMITPIIITGSVRISERIIIGEEIIEVILLGILLFLSIIIFNLYKQEVRKQKEFIAKIYHEKKTTEEKLFESMSYIGKVNVQLDEIKSIFSATNKYPETKNDFKKSFHFLSERVLGIVNTNWVLFRIIDRTTHKTISECYETRQDYSGRYPHVSNKMIAENQLAFPFTTVMIDPPHMKILVCCSLPVDKISTDQRVFIQVILNEITMLFVILTSLYYKNESDNDRKMKHSKSQAV